MPPTALTLLVATAGLAAVAFALLVLHAASRGRNAADATALSALHAYYAELDALSEQSTEPLPAPPLDTPVRVSEPNLGERSA